MSLPYSARYPVIQTQTWTKLGEKDYIRKYYARLISALLTLYQDQAHLQGRA